MPKFNRLFISEKADAAKKLAAFLAKKTGKQCVSRGGYFEVGDDAIAPMSGHLLEQVHAHEYDPKYKDWRLADLPIIPSPFKLAIKPGEGQYKGAPKAKVDVIRRLLPECTTVIGFGDPDAEGQLLQDELLIFLGNRKPVMRLWAQALDDTTLDKALSAMKPNEQYIGFYESALSRSQSDWLYGINLTRACTIHAQAAGASWRVTNIGRVQTPTLALVVNRELEIRNFKPVDFHVPYIGLATSPGFKAVWIPRENDKGDVDDARVDSEGRLLDKAKADAIAAGARQDGAAVVLKAETKPGTEAAPLPFSLSSLQALCSKNYGLSAADTLKIAQSLYMKALTSYPRVDCDYLPESQHADAPKILASLGKAQLPTVFTTALLGAKPALKSKAWNDTNVTAHHAIVPIHLDNPGEVAGLSDIEAKVYYEIVKRYILQFWPVAKFNATDVLLSCGPTDAKETYKARGKVWTDDGWRKAFAIQKDADEDEEEAASGALPAMSKGQALPLAIAGVDSHRTKEPKRFTDGTLIIAMKNIHLYVQDPEYRRRLKEGVGIGTEATRSTTIDGLKRNGFLTEEKKELRPSEVAIRIITSLPPSMRTPDMTAMWQQLNEEVMARRARHPDFIAKMVPWVTKLVAESANFFKPGQFSDLAGGGANSSSAGKPRITETAHKCFGEVGKPGCGSPLKHIPGVSGKYRSFFGCSNAECKKGFLDVDGAPKERPPAVDKPDENAPKYACPSCKEGSMRKIPRKDGGFFWGCGNYKSGCKSTCNDVDGVPDLEGKTSRQAPAQQTSEHLCPQCQQGHLMRQARRDKTGYFWGCSDWRNGCKAMFSDLEGQPDLEGKSKQGGGWRNGAPVLTKPRNSGHASGYRGGRAVTPQMAPPRK
ncbi:DNA topoisomerase-3 [Roseateles asaccharophilus]|uniref:DNA topoisomerase n=1 Tax=Roseateles asaccharophilus TaxID=582607 RepID=UPI003837C643